MAPITQKEFRKFIDALDFTRLSDIYDAHNKYYSSDGWTKGRNRTVYFNYCHELLEDMIDRDATVEEIERVIIFAYVVLDSEKFKLDIFRAKEDLEINELYKKYVIGG